MKLHSSGGGGGGRRRGKGRREGRRGRRGRGDGGGGDSVLGTRRGRIFMIFTPRTHWSKRRGENCENLHVYTRVTTRPRVDVVTRVVGWSVLL